MPFTSYVFGYIPTNIAIGVSSDNRRFYSVGESSALSVVLIEPGDPTAGSRNYSGFRDQQLSSVVFPGYINYGLLGYVNGFSVVESYDRAWVSTYPGALLMFITNTPNRIPQFLFSVTPVGSFIAARFSGDLIYVPSTNMVYYACPTYDRLGGYDGTSLKALFQSDVYDGGNDAVAISKDLTTLYVANSQTFVLRTINATTGAISAVVNFAIPSTPNGPPATAINLQTCIRTHTDGRVFVGWVGVDYRLNISTFSAAGALVTNWVVGLSISPSDGRFDLSHDQTQIVCSHGAIVSTVDGSLIDHILTDTYQGNQVRMAPNGERCYVSGQFQVTAIQGFTPALSMTAGTWGSIATLNVMSVPIGSTINFLLNYPSEPSNTYQLAAATGRDNPIRLPRGREVGIDRDATAQYTIRPNRPEFTGFHGTLNSSGAATMNLSLDPAIPGVVQGARLYVTATTFAGGLRRLSAIQSIANVCIIDIL